MALSERWGAVNLAIGFGSIAQKRTPLARVRRWNTFCRGTDRRVAQDSVQGEPRNLFNSREQTFDFKRLFETDVRNSRRTRKKKAVKISEIFSV
jgi:hypothetical protein